MPIRKVKRPDGTTVKIEITSAAGTVIGQVTAGAAAQEQLQESRAALDAARSELASLQEQQKQAQSNAEERIRLMQREEELAQSVRKFEIATSRALLFGENPFSTLEQLHDQSLILSQREIDSLQDNLDVYGKGRIDTGKFPIGLFSLGLVGLLGFAFYRIRARR